MNIPKIAHAYEHIKNSCEERLRTIYPNQIPPLVWQRYQQELSYLQDSEYLDDFEICRLLNEEAGKCSQYFTIRGTTAGSYLIYLLGNSLTNPLPPHYHCPKCGHFELAGTRLFGIDLPTNACPACGTTMLSDGYNLSVENVWGLDGKKPISFDYNIDEAFLPFARRMLERTYPDNETAPLGMMSQASKDSTVSMCHCGFLILPSGRSMQDYPELLSYLEDGRTCLTGNLRDIAPYHMHRVFLSPHKTIHYLLAMQQKTGIYIRELSNRDLQPLTWNDLANTHTVAEALFRAAKPKSFTDMISLEACCHASYQNDAYSKEDSGYERLLKIRESPELTEYPCYTRDDFFDTLLTLNLERPKAFELSEWIWKGKAAFPDSLAAFEQYHLPDALKKAALRYRYLFPRAHCAEYILSSALLAYYMKKDSRVFSRIV